METVLIKHEIPIDEYKTMSDDKLLSIVRMYSGRLIKIEEKDDIVILYIVAPSTWRLCLTIPLLLPYRYI